MGFRIAYTKLFTLRAWHPDYLGTVSSAVPVPAGTTLTLQERQDYLGYDVRDYLDIRPLPGAPDVVDRYGLRWVRNTQGGWLLARDTFTITDPSVRLTLGVYLRDPAFAECQYRCRACAGSDHRSATRASLPPRPVLHGAPGPNGAGHRHDHPGA